MSKLETLRTSLATAKASYDTVAQRHMAILTEEKRSVTADEASAKTEARSLVEQLEVAVSEELKAEAERSAFTEAEKRKLGNADPTIRVTSEPTTYGPQSRYSYLADLAAAGDIRFPNHRAANERMVAHREEVRSIIDRDPSSKEARALLKAIRGADRSETRAVDTTSGSMGDFAPNVYLLQDYAPFRLPGRAFADACNTMELPPTGNVISIPRVTLSAQTAQQNTQNTAITETDPTAAYANGTVVTLAGQVTVSQQYLDRVGPGVAGDQIIRDSLQRSLNQQIDEYVINQVTSQISQVEANGAYSSASFFGAVGNAKQVVETNSGVIAYPSHIFTDPKLAEYIASRSDTVGHPVFAPSAVAYNPLGVGDWAAQPEGDMGFTVGGLHFMKDQNIQLENSATPTNHQLLVGYLGLVYVLEGEPNYRVLPQPAAADLSVIIQLWTYVTAILPYPGAVVTLTGTLFADSGLVF